MRAIRLHRPESFRMDLVGKSYEKLSFDKTNDPLTDKEDIRNDGAREVYLA